MTKPVELKTLGLCALHDCYKNSLFRVNSGIPIEEALSQASDLLGLATTFAEDAAYQRNTDRPAWAAHHLTAMGRAVVDDVVAAIRKQKASS